MYVCICMYVCMYACMYVCMYVCMSMYACICICMYVYVCMYVCVCMYVYVCVCVCMCMYVYVCVCMYVCVFMYVCKWGPKHSTGTISMQQNKSDNASRVNSFSLHQAIRLCSSSFSNVETCARKDNFPMSYSLLYCYTSLPICLAEFELFTNLKCSVSLEYPPVRHQTW